MLFISRIAGLGIYGVVDTDDGVEEVVDEVALWEAKSQLGLDIRGVSEVDETTVIALPYQDTSTMTLLQTKTSVLHKVDVKVYNGYITSIIWHEITEPVYLRLSDFGDRCESCILYGNKAPGWVNMFLILDDKIKSISEHTFTIEGWSTAVGKDGRGVSIDVRECTNEVLVDMVYRSLMYRSGWKLRFVPLELFDSIIDNPVRKERMLQRLKMESR